MAARTTHRQGAVTHIRRASASGDELITGVRGALHAFGPTVRTTAGRQE